MARRATSKRKLAVKLLAIFVMAGGAGKAIADTPKTFWKAPKIQVEGVYPDVVAAMSDSWRRDTIRKGLNAATSDYFQGDRATSMIVTLRSETVDLVILDQVTRKVLTSRRGLPLPRASRHTAGSIEEAVSAWLVELRCDVGCAGAGIRKKAPLGTTRKIAGQPHRSPAQATQRVARKPVTTPRTERPRTSGKQVFGKAGKAEVVQEPGMETGRRTVPPLPVAGVMRIDIVADATSGAPRTLPILRRRVPTTLSAPRWSGTPHRLKSPDMDGSVVAPGTDDAAPTAPERRNRVSEDAKESTDRAVAPSRDSERRQDTTEEDDATPPANDSPVVLAAFTSPTAGIRLPAPVAGSARMLLTHENDGEGGPVEVTDKSFDAHKLKADPEVLPRQGPTLAKARWIGFTPVLYNGADPSDGLWIAGPFDDHEGRTGWITDTATGATTPVKFHRRTGRYEGTATLSMAAAVALGIAQGDVANVAVYLQN